MKLTLSRGHAPRYLEVSYWPKCREVYFKRSKPPMWTTLNVGPLEFVYKAKE